LRSDTPVREVWAEREIRRAVTNLSHHLRTPLTAISGYLGLSIARMLVQQMGGLISADYRDGWLTIRLNFPVDYTGQDGIISNI